MSASTELFSHKITAVAPSLRPVLSKHLEENFDEMLPHLYLSDVSRWVVAEVAKPATSPEVSRVLQFLDSSYPTADYYVQNLIDVSFVEMVQDDPAVVRLFGPNLLSRVDKEYLPG